MLAHDRAGFGGGVVTLGLTTALCLWCSRPSRNLHQAVALAGAASLGAALSVHLVVGYTDAWHLLPAGVGALSLVAGLVLEHPGVPKAARPRGAHRQVSAAEHLATLLWRPRRHPDGRGGQRDDRRQP